MKELKKNELQMASMALLQAVILSRRTFASWFLRHRKPTKNELMRMMHYMRLAESIFDGENFDNEQAAGAFGSLRDASREIDAEIDAEDAA